MNALLRTLPEALQILTRRDLSRVAAALERAGYAAQAAACRGELARRAA